MTDLGFLDSLIKGKRIVLLGECGHFDGSTLIAKVRLIKYLHEKHGFNILLYERNIYEAYRAVEDARSGRDSLVGTFAHLMDVFPSQTSEPYRLLARYIDTTMRRDGNQALQFCGIDTDYNRSYFFAFIQDVIDAIELHSSDERLKELKKHWRNLFHIGKIRSYKPGDKLKEMKIDVPLIRESAAGIIDFFYSSMSLRYINEKGRNKLRFLIQCIRAYVNAKEQAVFERTQPDAQFHYASLKVREKGMADNILWYIDSLYQNEKFVISASSFHTSRNATKIDPLPEELKDCNFTMTDLVAEKYGSEMYSIAFVYYEGLTGVGPHPEYLAPGKREQPKPEGSLEYWLHQKGSPYLFFDFRNLGAFDSSESFLMMPTFEKPYRAKWQQVYDAVFFIDQMQPVIWKVMFDRRERGSPYEIPKEWLR